VSPASNPWGIMEYVRSSAGAAGCADIFRLDFADTFRLGCADTFG
jgi:hypothetical protein